MAESEEGRPLIKENIHQPSTRPTQSGARVSQGLAGVRKVARDHKEMKFTALLHHVTVDLLRDSFSSLKRKAAPGVDGMTWQEYEAGLEGRLADLHSRLHRGAYRALPSRRVYIEKGDGRMRPLGIAALEDKIVQHAVVKAFDMVHARLPANAPVEIWLGESKLYTKGKLAISEAIKSIRGHINAGFLANEKLLLGPQDRGARLGGEAGRL